jgi:hypothetical protein
MVEYSIWYGKWCGVVPYPNPGQHLQHGPRLGPFERISRENGYTHNFLTMDGCTFGVDIALRECEASVGKQSFSVWPISNVLGRPWDLAEDRVCWYLQRNLGRYTVYFRTSSLTLLGGRNRHDYQLRWWSWDKNLHRSVPFFEFGDASWDSYPRECNIDQPIGNENLATWLQ